MNFCKVQTLPALTGSSSGTQMCADSDCIYICKLTSIIDIRVSFRGGGGGGTWELQPLKIKYCPL